MKKYILPLFALIMLAALIWYATSHPAALKPASGTNSAAAAPQVIHEEGTYYTADATYPKSTGLTGASDAAAVALMKAWASDSIAQFKTDSGLNTMSAKDAQIMGLGPDRKLAIDITYEQKISPHTVSYVYMIYSDTGGAHPNTYYHTFTFDTRSGVLLSLADLFAPSSSYLAKLSEISRARLAPIIAAREELPVAEIDHQMLDDGTAAREDNFSTFYFESADFVLLFPPYQIGPYVLGSTTLHLPAADLMAILKSQYP